MNVTLYLILITLTSLVLGVAIGIYFDFPTKKICYINSDCSWHITNCCPENTGAMWECVDLREFKKPECTENLICPQVIMPRPGKDCVCERGSCVVE